jgi:hypothetical protein
MGACGTSSWAEAWRGGGPGRRRRWAPQPPRVLTSEVAEAVEEMVSTDAMGAGSSSPRARTAMDRSPETVSSPRSGPATNHLQGASHRRPSPTSRTRPTAPWPPPMLRVRPRRRPPPGRLAVPGQPSPVKIDLVASAADQAPRRQDGHISPAAASWFSAAARGSTSSGWTRFPAARSPCSPSPRRSCTSPVGGEPHQAGFAAMGVFFSTLDPCTDMF